MKKIFKLILLLFLSIVFVFIQPFIIGTRVETLQELTDVKFGFPITYTSMSLHLSPTEDDLPITVTMPGPRQSGLTNYYSNIIFWIDVLIIFISILFITFLWKRLMGYMNKE
ncbi:hypothetical protein FZW96_21385 [Bacillus sp. BGMRC 2118]|nr:hypothetical protein FZW96_21385 [Bacillus sp. BGMRC 2118]